MGVIKLFSSSSSDSNRGNEPVLPNPNPNNYKILKSCLNRNETAFAIMIQYLDCTNYEGKKILVYRGREQELIKQGSIDPHFSDATNYMSPIARFVPTHEGWKMAQQLIRSLGEENGT